MYHSELKILSVLFVTTCSYLLFNSRQLDAQLLSSSYLNSRHVRRERVSWCCTSDLERRKCLDWARAIEDVNIQYESQEPFELNLDCELASDKDQCMSLVDDERADMVLLDPGEIAVAGRHHSLIPIMAERYGPSRTELGKFSVAIVKKRNMSIQSLADLYGKRACFSGVSHMASWTLPLSTLIDLSTFDIVDCNNIVKSASHFFGNSCAPNALINKFNPTGDNPQSITSLCDNQNGRVGAHSEPYSGILSALKCLNKAESFSPPSLLINLQQFNNRQPGSGIRSSFVDNNLRDGDVAFVPHNAIFLADKLASLRDLRAELAPKADLELLCPQGGRQPLERWQNCNFGFVAAHAVVVSSQKSQEKRLKIQKFLKTSVQLFGGDLNLNLGVDIRKSGQRQNSQFQQEYPTLQQQQQLPPLAFESRSALSFGQQSGDTSNSLKPITNFKLTGDQMFSSYQSLDVLFSSDMTDLVPLVGVYQTLKGYLNSYPVQLATRNDDSSSGSGSGSRFGTAPQSAPVPPPMSFSEYFQYPFRQAAPVIKYVEKYATKINSQTDYFENIKRCSAPATTLCVVSEKEFDKCQAMSKAFHAASLKPDLNCKLASSSVACMQMINNRDADLVMLDPADVYLAGMKYNLISILSEQVESRDSGEYVVAVAKKSDQSIDLFSLNNKRSCHSGYMKAAGWVLPISFLLNNDKLRRDNGYECDSTRAAAELFDKSCAPGIMVGGVSADWQQLGNGDASGDGATSQWILRNMCELCHGSGRSYCARDSSEPFFGDTGAFRCLVEGGGEVAFLKHSAIYSNTGGSNRQTWARNLIRADFELLCREGSRAPVEQFASCNLGKVPHNAMVARKDSPQNLLNAYANLFLYGQQYYGSKYSEDYTFKMFSSRSGANVDSMQSRDLIFDETSQQLVKVPHANQTYNRYLDKSFLRAMQTVLCIQ